MRNKFDFEVNTKLIYLTFQEFGLYCSKILNSKAIQMLRRETLEKSQK